MEEIVRFHSVGFFKPIDGHLNMYTPLESRIQPCPAEEATIYLVAAACGCNTHAEAGERVGRSFGLVNCRGLTFCDHHNGYYFRHVHSPKDEHGHDTLAFKMRQTAYNDREA